MFPGMEALPIIRTKSGEWVAPRDTLIIPPSLQYNGLPLFDKAERNCIEQIAECIEILPDSEYDFRFLETLGGKTLCKDQVRCILSDSGVEFSAKEYGWISALFRYLHENPDADPLTAPYLHLQNGQWIAPQDGPAYVGDLTELPFDLAEISSSLINPAFTDEIMKIETAKRYLTEMLKIETVSESTILKAIFDRHSQEPAESDSGTETLDKDICHAHALYLTQHQHLIDWDKISETECLFFVVTHNGTLSGSKDAIANRMISLGKEKSVPISDLAPPSIPFLDPIYPPEVSQFLTEHLGVKPYLPLTEPIPLSEHGLQEDDESTQPGKLHSIFTTTLSPANAKWNFVLYYLSAIWYEIPLLTCQGNFLHDLQNLPCLCENGQYVPLCQTSLRTGQLSKLLSPETNLLQLLSPESPKWGFLKELGVITEPSIELFIQYLRVHTDKPIEERINKSFLEGIYGDLVEYVRTCSPASLGLLRESFANESLLVAAYGASRRYMWAPSEAVYSACPEFVRSTLAPVPTKSQSYKDLCHFLDLTAWRPEILLASELISTFKTGLKPKKWQKYLHQALEWIAREETYLSPAGPQAWVLAILELPIYPILTKTGKTLYSSLRPSIAVPDSLRLRRYLKGEIDILDFGDLPLENLLPILKCARDPPIFLSDYDTPEEFQITEIEPVTLDVFHSRFLWMKRKALIRYTSSVDSNNGSFLYYRGHQKEKDGFAWVFRTFDSISILRAARLTQTIWIPELGLSTVLSHISSLVQRNIPVIYISTTADADVTITLLAEHLAEIFDAVVYSEQIEMILRTHERQMDHLLTETFQVPQLPDSCHQLLLDDDGSLCYNLFEDTVEEVITDSEPFEPPRFEFIRPRTATLEITEKGEDDYEAFMHDVTRDFQENLGYTRYKELTPAPRTGFAGEFFVFSSFRNLLTVFLLLNHCLPGFSEANWTSQYRQYAGYAKCEEGDSDFFYHADMSALTRLFSLGDQQGWKRAFIEVKTGNGGESPRFKMSAAQFYRARRWHATETLYLVLYVQNVFTDPSISHVIDDPIRFLEEEKLSISSTITLSIGPDSKD